MSLPTPTPPGFQLFWVCYIRLRSWHDLGNLLAYLGYVVVLDDVAWHQHGPVHFDQLEYAIQIGDKVVLTVA